MLPEERFLNLSLEFWANVKLLNQRLGYAERATRQRPQSAFVIPTVSEICEVFESEGLNPTKLIEGDCFTKFGQQIVEYMQYRSQILTNQVRTSLMDQQKAKRLFYSKREELHPQCPLPMNKQSGTKRDYAFLTGLVNMLIEQQLGNERCDYDPHELTSIIEEGFPVRTLSRRVDGAYPSTKNPLAIWEIKEYYYTTTFGSRVSDGVYETQLDGWELREVKQQLNRNIKHYLIVDDYYTWWEKGRSYLCRLIDLMHMGLVDEVIFGEEVLTRIPVLVKEWTAEMSSQH